MASPNVISKSRLRFVSAEVSERGAYSEARVVLRQSEGAAEVVGVATAPRGGERARLLAAATLRAVEGGEREAWLHLLDITQVALGERQAVVLLVALRTHKGDDLLMGSALLRSEPDRAAVAAALDAVNRRLASLEAASGAR